MSSVRAAGALRAARTPLALWAPCFPSSAPECSGPPTHSLLIWPRPCGERTLRLSTLSLIQARTGRKSSCRIGPQHSHLFALGPQAGNRLGDDLVLQRSFEVDEEHVEPELLAHWARLDLRQVDLAPSELVQAQHEPAGVVGAGAPEHEGSLAPVTWLRMQWRRPRSKVSSCQPNETRLVVFTILDSLGDHSALVQFRGQSRPNRSERAVLALAYQSDCLSRRAGRNDARSRE